MIIVNYFFTVIIVFKNRVHKFCLFKISPPKNFRSDEAGNRHFNFRAGQKIFGKSNANSCLFIYFENNIFILNYYI